MDVKEMLLVIIINAKTSSVIRFRYSGKENFPPCIQQLMMHHDAS